MEQSYNLHIKFDQLKTEEAEVAIKKVEQMMRNKYKRYDEVAKEFEKFFSHDELSI